MGILSKLKGIVRKFSSTSTISVGSALTTSIVQDLANESQFDSMGYADVYEHIYTHEPEVASAVDKVAELVAMAYQGVTCEDSKTRAIAELVAKRMDIKRFFEVIAGLLMVHGNAYIKVNVPKKGLPTLSVLPNKLITIVDSRSRIGQWGGMDVITEANFYVLNENRVALGVSPKVFKASDIIHVKFKDIPLFVQDSMGRNTFGLYDVSPLERVKRFVQWKRQIMMIDVMWRWRNVPREHHVISTDQFDLSKYTGTLDERRKQAEEDAKNALESYIASIKDKQPDQAYVTTDTITISMLESKTKYTEPNKLLSELLEIILMALGIPESVVRGKSQGSYASEVVISNWLTARIIRIAEKIKEALLPIVKQGVKRVDPTLDVSTIDMKVELILDMNRMELFRQAAVMSSIGAFTVNEIRGHLGYDPIPGGDALVVTNPEKRGRNKGEKTDADVTRDVVKGDAQPITPWSEEESRHPD